MWDPLVFITVVVSGSNCGENSRWDESGEGGAATVRTSDSRQATESLRLKKSSSSGE